MKRETQPFTYAHNKHRYKAGEMMGSNLIIKAVHYDAYQLLTFVKLSKYSLIRKIQIACIKKFARL